MIIHQKKIIAIVNILYEFESHSPTSSHAVIGTITKLESPSHLQKHGKLKYIEISY